MGRWSVRLRDDEDDQSPLTLWCRPAQCVKQKEVSASEAVTGHWGGRWLILPRWPRAQRLPPRPGESLRVSDGAGEGRGGSRDFGSRPWVATSRRPVDGLDPTYVSVCSHKLVLIFHLINVFSLPSCTILCTSL